MLVDFGRQRGGGTFDNAGALAEYRHQRVKVDALGTSMSQVFREP